MSEGSEFYRPPLSLQILGAYFHWKKKNKQNKEKKNENS